MRRKLLIGAVLVAVVAAAASTYAWAAGSAATQTLNACVDREGQLRLVAIAGDCKRAETPLSWNTVGPAGAPGADGKQGIPGRDGLTGPQGPAGAPGSAAADPTAVTATMTITGQGFDQSAIAITGYSHEIVSPRDAASGQATGKRQHKPLTIRKEIDKATPLLMRAVFTNQTMPEILIGLLRSGTQVATVKLSNAQVSNVTTNGATESVSFTYQKITWTWVDGGVTAVDDWQAITG